MKKFQNESTLDRVIRLILGIVLLWLSFTSFSGGARSIGTVIGGILIFTALTGFCLIYKIFNFKTN